MRFLLSEARFHLVRFASLFKTLRSAGAFLFNPLTDPGAVLFLKRHDGRIRVVLYSRRVADRINSAINMSQVPDDWKGRKDYRVIYEHVEWPFPADPFPGGKCAGCHRPVESK